MNPSIWKSVFSKRLKGRSDPVQLKIPAGPENLSPDPQFHGVDHESRAIRPAERTNVLFTFVDLKDPFVPGEIAGEDLPGPILSIMAAKDFKSLFLFHTPHTQALAEATRREVLQRYPDCHIAVYEIPTSDPKDYSALIGSLTRIIRHDYSSVRDSTKQDYVCVSSGTAEMRASWFLLNAIGVLPAIMLQVGSPVTPLYGAANVKEVWLDSASWQTVRQLALPWQYHARYASSPMPGSSPHDHRARSLASNLPDEAVARSLPGFTRPLTGKRHAAEEEVELFGEPTPVPIIPGLDGALQEMGLHVGSALLRYAAERAAVAAESSLPILLTGETGTGKERFAHLIHRMSPRAKNGLVAVNCAAIPESLAESYLFGHTKGSFSGASSDKQGVFESADGSTLFLDEIAELSFETQAKLLRVIQDGMVQRIGAVKARRVDVRIIAATNRDLKKEVSDGRFREDLYFRLEVVHIKLPTLRERRSEISSLALILLKQINQRRQKPRQLSKEALFRLENYAWPGNVRQLLNVLERSVLFARSDVLGPEDLLITEDGHAEDPFASLPEPAEGFSMEAYLDQARKQLFLRALAKCGNNQSEAARLLGITRQAMNKFVAGQNDNRD